MEELKSEEQGATRTERRTLWHLNLFIHQPSSGLKLVKVLMCGPIHQAFFQIFVNIFLDGGVGHSSESKHQRNVLRHQNETPKIKELLHLPTYHGPHLVRSSCMVLHTFHGSHLAELALKSLSQPNHLMTVHRTSCLIGRESHSSFQNSLGRPEKWGIFQAV